MPSSHSEKRRLLYSSPGDFLRGIEINKEGKANVPWFPRSAADLDLCSQDACKFDPYIDPRHPGFGDHSYLHRRDALKELAKSFRFGEDIPFVDYTDVENATWTAVFDRLRQLHKEYACDSYKRNLSLLVSAGIFVRKRIPQLQDVSKFLEKRTGFVLRPCPGLLSPRDFLASLAFRVFQATPYLRHSGSPHHSPEPDYIHELIGHVPMLADASLAQLSQEIGLASLGASDDEIQRLSKLYWFIIEFGLCLERDRVKAIGAGLLSAYGELEYACSSFPEHLPFDPAEVVRHEYDDSSYQPAYFVADGIKEALCQIKNYAETIRRPFKMHYDAAANSVTVLKAP